VLAGNHDIKVGTSQAANLQDLILGCQEGRRESRADLYRAFYDYAMSICLRYSRDREEAKEIVNDGFLKVFAHIKDKYDSSRSFKSWLRRILINAAIDFYRRNEKHYHALDIVYARDVVVEPDALSQLTEAEIMEAVQQLPPSYRYVFNLYVVEGFKHHEIAQKLNISVGTSKSNLAKARMKLKMMLQHLHEEGYQDYG
jgi:RNA polymerase sigma-70 factor (ECF subfamily)